MQGKLYRPSNGTEGIMFMERWCFQCTEDQAFRETHGAEDGCPIVAAAMLYSANEDGYPREWTFDRSGQPCCTAFDAIERKEDDGDEAQEDQ